MKLLQTPPCILLAQNLEKNFKKEERDGGYKKEIPIVRVIFLCPLDQKLARQSVYQCFHHIVCYHSLLNANVRHTRTIETSNLKQKYHGNAWLLKA